MNSCPSMPKPNEGTVDRVIRVVVGVVLWSIALTRLTGILQIAAAIAGTLALATGAIGFCGLYKILGISTTGKK